MVHGSRYRVQLRRRREQKTDYQARKGFVVSGRARLVARSSLKNTVAQIIIAKPHGDEVLASAHSHELMKKYGWKGCNRQHSSCLPDRFALRFESEEERCFRGNFGSWVGFTNKRLQSVLNYEWCRRCRYRDSS